MISQCARFYDGMWLDAIYLFGNTLVHVYTHVEIGIYINIYIYIFIYMCVLYMYIEKHKCVCILAVPAIYLGMCIYIYN